MRIVRLKRRVLLAAPLMLGLILSAGVVQAKPAATVGKKTISMAEVDERAKSISMKPYQALFDARKAALDQLVEEALLDTEAKKRGIKKAKLIQDEITAKIAPITDADAKVWYDKNPNRVRGREYEQVKPTILRFLATDGETQARKSFIDGLKKGANVKLSLEPPRVTVKVAANDPRKGPKGAAVQIVEFSDFQ